MIEFWFFYFFVILVIETLPILLLGKMKPEILRDFPRDIVSGRSREGIGTLLSLDSVFMFIPPEYHSCEFDFSVIMSVTPMTKKDWIFKMLSLALFKLIRGLVPVLVDSCTYFTVPLAFSAFPFSAQRFLRHFDFCWAGWAWLIHLLLFQPFFCVPGQGLCELPL